MAGHSKWKNIRLRKGKQDAIRGKLFTKLSREIIVAARMGGGDPSGNPRLRLAISKAREAAMPSDNVERAIKRGTGETEGAAYEEVTYEGYGPGGAALIVECYTENRNRTVADLRHAFSKNGGNLAENGSVAWRFKYIGEIIVPPDGLDEEEFTLAAIDAGAEDVVRDDDGFNVYTSIETLHSTNEALETAGYKPAEVGLTYLPADKAELSDSDARRLLNLMEMLEDLDDVKETYVNVEITDDMMDDA
ncbi:MAG: YebC/PmpR family DNA-binding transcriptional regulator [Fimbriimonadaceae bacterium]|nr:YebC/PmpR family DNA-binding transcriptional regulator [Fimbriimonadaceae bacterium]RIK00206.1 MAG: YebC/PmpR family DNA-binding transcriptional regulator [Armatimonadota bacterium]